MKADAKVPGKKKTVILPFLPTFPFSQTFYKIPCISHM